MYRENVKMGVFLPPHHPNNEDPTLALQRDFELVEFLDRLGYHEAWIGEHHSGGFEIISSPEIFIAAAAERTGIFLIELDSIFQENKGFR